MSARHELAIAAAQRQNAETYMAWARVSPADDQMTRREWVRLARTARRVARRAQAVARQAGDAGHARWEPRL